MKHHIPRNRRDSETCISRPIFKFPVIISGFDRPGVVCHESKFVDVSPRSCCLPAPLTITIFHVISAAIYSPPVSSTQVGVQTDFDVSL